MQFRIDWLTAAQLHDAETATLPVIRVFCCWSLLEFLKSVSLASLFMGTQFRNSKCRREL